MQDIKTSWENGGVLDCLDTCKFDTSGCVDDNNFCSNGITSCSSGCKVKIVTGDPDGFVELYNPVWLDPLADGECLCVDQGANFGGQVMTYYEPGKQNIRRGCKDANLNKCPQGGILDFSDQFCRVRLDQFVDPSVCGMPNLNGQCGATCESYTLYGHQTTGGVPVNLQPNDVVVLPKSDCDTTTSNRLFWSGKSPTTPWIPNGLGLWEKTLRDINGDMCFGGTSCSCQATNVNAATLGSLKPHADQWGASSDADACTEDGWEFYFCLDNVFSDSESSYGDFILKTPFSCRTDTQEEIKCTIEHFLYNPAWAPWTNKFLAVGQTTYNDGTTEAQHTCSVLFGEEDDTKKLHFILLDDVDDSWVTTGPYPVSADRWREFHSDNDDSKGKIPDIYPLFNRCGLGAAC